MASANYPSLRTLPNVPDLAQLRRQAKELLKRFAAGDADAVAEVNAHYQGANAETFALHDAQLVLSRLYGFLSWPKLKAYVDGATVGRLADAVHRDDLGAVRSIIGARPELVNISRAEHDEHRALHYAVLERRPEIVRFLMQQGADARVGIWPHRGATSALTLATERGFTEIVAIVLEEESRRGSTPLASLGAAASTELVGAFERGDEEAMIAAFGRHPELVHVTGPKGRTALHWATARLWPRVTGWLLDHGADVDARAHTGETPIDIVGHDGDIDAAHAAHLTTRIVEILLERGAVRTARWAVFAGDTNWLRARHAAGGLTSQRGLVSHAVKTDRPDMLRLLLELGLDPDEAGKVEGLDDMVPTWGEPLRECALSGRIALAEILLEHRANPNTNVYAASSALSEAYARHDEAMVALLERLGGRLSPVSVGILGLTQQAASLLADDAAGRTPEGSTSPGSSVAQDLLWGGIESPSPEIVRMALERIEWAPDDPRWHSSLENGLYLGPKSNRPAHLEGFRLVLKRSDPSVRNKRGTTLLHDVAASRGGLTASDRIAFASLLLDAGARLDLRDDLLKSTPLGWACRWGRIELVKLLLERGADPIEADADSWATPMAWALKMSRSDVIAELHHYAASTS